MFDVMSRLVYDVPTCSDRCATCALTEPGDVAMCVLGEFSRCDVPPAHRLSVLKWRAPLPSKREKY